jgi:hypothetical protein
MLNDVFDREYVHVVGEHEEYMDGGIVGHAIETKHLMWATQSPLFTMDSNTKCSKLTIVLMLII